MGEKAIILSI